MRPPARPPLHNCQMGVHTCDVKVSGWADVAWMQEQVAHLPDAVRRDRWSREYWTTEPSYLSTLEPFFFHFSTRSDSSHIAFLGDRDMSIIRVCNITLTHTHTRAHTPVDTHDPLTRCRIHLHRHQPKTNRHASPPACSPLGRTVHPCICLYYQACVGQPKPEVQCASRGPGLHSLGERLAQTRRQP